MYLVSNRDSPNSWSINSSILQSITYYNISLQKFPYSLWWNPFEELLIQINPFWRTWFSAKSYVFYVNYEHSIEINIYTHSNRYWIWQHYKETPSLMIIINNYYRTKRAFENNEANWLLINCLNTYLNTPSEGAYCFRFSAYL